MKAKKTTSIALNDSIFRQGGGSSYTPPEISIHALIVESGFANSLSITSPDDDLPQIDDLENWDKWE